MRYNSRQDAIEQAITPALGEDAHDIDVDAVFAATYEYRVDTDADGNQLLNTAGFEQVVDTEEFWEIVKKNDRTQS